MAGRARPASTGPARVDRRACALLVEEVQRVARERRVDVAADVQVAALDAVDPQPVHARAGERGDVGDMDMIARGRIVATDDGAAGQHGPAGLVDHGPGERRRRRIGDDRLLGIVGAEAELVEVDDGRGQDKSDGHQIVLS